MIVEIFKAIQISMPDKKDSTSQSNDKSTSSKQWPWDWFYYMGTVVLGMDERTFWRTQLRKLMALWDIHKQVNGLDKDDENEVEEVFIDQLW